MCRTSIEFFSRLFDRRPVAPNPIHEARHRLWQSKAKDRDFILYPQWHIKPLFDYISSARRKILAGAESKPSATISEGTLFWAAIPVKLGVD